MAYASCKVCEHHERYDIELAYMTGERTGLPFSRAVIERHMAHVTSPEAMKIALGMNSAAAIASRLRHLESQATTILDMAMAVKTDDDGTVQLANPKLALAAMKEVRATMELEGRIAGSLVDRVQVDSARPDLDSAIADALAARGHRAGPQDAAAEQSDEEPKTPPAQLALPPGDSTTPQP